ncbi:hypothetical protein [Prevotella sp. P6B4]|uniref:hypothetical protein n=1 Tax=Prevotella sp. P6B4 TaxID=1410614 RepID=UPI000A44668D|nr:hypothetical protein [Prevotella sp. P6B4]
MAKVLLINGSPRENGNTKMVEKVPSLNIEEQAGANFIIGRMEELVDIICLEIQ